MPAGRTSMPAGCGRLLCCTGVGRSRSTGVGRSRPGGADAACGTLGACGAAGGAPGWTGVGRSSSTGVGRSDGSIGGAANGSLEGVAGMLTGPGRSRPPSGETGAGRSSSCGERLSSSSDGDSRPERSNSATPGIESFGLKVGAGGGGGVPERWVAPIEGGPFGAGVRGGPVGGGGGANGEAGLEGGETSSSRPIDGGPWSSIGSPGNCCIAVLVSSGIRMTGACSDASGPPKNGGGAPGACPARLAPHFSQCVAGRGPVGIGEPQLWQFCMRKGSQQ